MSSRLTDRLSEGISARVSARATAEAVALICSGFFAGGALYISLVEHPSRAYLTPTEALRQWRPSYKIATAWQATNAALGMLVSPC
jgi:hypothetical protein